jgi:hypothetical protein
MSVRTSSFRGTVDDAINACRCAGVMFLLFILPLTVLFRRPVVVIFHIDNRLLKDVKVVPEEIGN